MSWHKVRGLFDESARDSISFALEGAKRMQRLIAGLLKYSRVTTQEKPFSLVSMETVLKNITRYLGESIQESSTVLTYDPLPEIYADEIQMEQLMQNLIGYALKFHGKKHSPYPYRLPEEE